MAYPDMQRYNPAQREAICESKWTHRPSAKREFHSEQGRATMDNEMNESWYRIVNSKGPDAEVYIYDEIGGNGIMAAAFVKDLQSVKGRINLHIHSPGGNVFEAITMFTALKQRDVTVYIDGAAFSAASLVAMAGQKIIIARHAMMMIHEAHGIEVGSAADMRHMADMLDLMSNDIAGIYAERAGGEVDVWRSAMAAETWYNDEQAVAAGLATEVANTPAIENHFDLSKYRNPPVVQKREQEPVEAPIDFVRLFEEATEGVL
jgi:ATP-dependent protease ClpP protease subunit